MPWRRFFRRAWWDDERKRELEAYLEIETDENIARGMSPDEARHAAQRKLGNPTQIREEIYAMNTLGMVDRLWQDLRHAGRVFRRNPGFTAVAVLTLALGIGGVTIIYSVIRSILLDPFPYTDSSRMVDVLMYDTATGGRLGEMAMPAFLDYQEQSDVFEDVIGTVSTRAMAMPTPEGSDVLAVSMVTPNAFAFLGVQPVIGRGIVAADGQATAPPVAVLSHDAWIDHFGGSPDVVGRAIVLDKVARTVVGVMPPRFTWHVADAWIPVALSRTAPDAQERAFWFQARLKRGVTIQQAEAQLNVIAARRAQSFPDEYPRQFRMSVVTVIDFVVGRFRGVLYTLFAAVGLLLLIACCNVANMLLARATARERELMLQAALGATRGRLIRQLMFESVLMAMAGAMAGAVLAYGGVKAVAYFLPQQNVPYEVVLRLDGSALLVSLATAAVTAILFGLLPAWHGARRDLVQGLKAGRGVGTGGRHGWLRNGLVVGEVALSLVLLLGAGLLMRSFIGLLQVDLGFNPDGIVMAAVRFPEDGYPPERRRAYYHDAVERIGALPGVVAVGVNSRWPLAGIQTFLERPGRPTSARAEARFNLASEGYLPAIDVRLVRGRLLSAADVAGGQHVAVVNETLVREHFGEEDAIGKPIRLSAMETLADPPADPTFEIVGVIGDIPNRGLRAVQPAAYVPLTVTGSGSHLIVARAAGDPTLAKAAVARTLRSVDRSVAFDDVWSLEEALNRTYAQPRFTMLILAAFAGIGLLLVAVGVYGVMAYSVSQQSREIAIRMALGADRRRLLWTVLLHGTWLLGGGIAIGLLSSVGTNRLLADDLWKTSVYDPLTMSAAVGVVVTMGLLACYVPARRAAGVDPISVLRHD